MNDNASASGRPPDSDDAATVERLIARVQMLEKALRDLVAENLDHDHRGERPALSRAIRALRPRSAQSNDGWHNEAGKVAEHAKDWTEAMAAFVVDDLTAEPNYVRCFDWVSA